MKRPKTHTCTECGQPFVWTREEQIAALKQVGVDHLIMENPGSEAIVVMKRLCPECRKGKK